MTDTRTYRAGYLAGLQLAIDMLRAELPVFNDAGEEFWPTPAETADMIAETRRVISIHPEREL